MASIALLNEIAKLNESRNVAYHPAFRGQTHLGSGCYSTVYADPESEFHVIKCGGGDAWANYAAYCIDNPDNDHLPRISFLKVVNGRYVACIERLTTVGDYQGTPKGKGKKMIDAWIQALSFFDKEQSDEWVWSGMRDVHDDPLYKTLFDINSTVGRTRDLSYQYNMMVRTDGTLVITDPIADQKYKGVDKYKLERFTYDGYVIPERAHSNERYMVRKEVRYTTPVHRAAQEDRPLQAEKSIAVCDARTGQVLGLLPQVPRELPAQHGTSFVKGLTDLQAAEARRKDMVIIDELKRGVPDDVWKNFINIARNDIPPDWLQVVTKRPSKRFFFEPIKLRKAVAPKSGSGR